MCFCSLDGQAKTATAAQMRKGSINSAVLGESMLFSMGTIITARIMGVMIWF